MSNWVIAYESFLTHPLSGPSEVVRVAHAFNLDDGEIAHPLETEVLVETDAPWSGSPEVKRCPRCLEALGEVEDH